MADQPQGPGWWMGEDGKWHPPISENNSPPTTIRPEPDDIEELQTESEEHIGGAEPASRGLKIMVAILAVLVVGVFVAVIVVSLGGDDAHVSVSDNTDAASAMHESNLNEPAVEDDASLEEPVDEPVHETAEEASSTPEGVAVDVDAITTDLMLQVQSSGAQIGFSVLQSGGDWFGLVAFAKDNEITGANTAFGTIHVWRHENSVWVEQTPLTTPFIVTSWEVADVTGEGDTDLIIEMMAPNSMVSGIATSASGVWKLGEFGHSEGGMPAFVDSSLVVENDQLVSFENTCEPSCSAGNNIRIVWSHSGSGVFVEASREPVQ